MEPKINCVHDRLVEPSKLVANPKNPNKHSKEQIERLAKIIDFQGQRAPIIISNQTGFIVVGHGRLEAMKLLGWDKVATDYQDFENEAAEYAHMCADNAIQEWASLDLAQINADFLDLGPEFDIDVLGIKGFEIDFAEKDLPEENSESCKCPTCGKKMKKAE